MKAIILTAGVGSRIRPLTDSTPKPLLPVGEKPILQRTVENLFDCGITEFIVVTGYMDKILRDFLRDAFPALSFTFIKNNLYDSTNTGYSLLLALPSVQESSFIKLDGDVVFEKAVIEKLIADSHENCICVDTNINLEAEEVKVQLDNYGKISAIGKSLDPHKSYGESIGIEKVGPTAGKKFYEILQNLMKDERNHQQYYDDSYTTLIQNGLPFSIVDVTGLKWVEIDTHQDYQNAQTMFLK